MRKLPVATKIAETANATRWVVRWPSTMFKEGKTYRASTYPDSNLVFIETAAKRRAIGGRTKTALEPVIRDALRRAGWGS